MKNYAFLISINHYTNNIEKLETPNNDSDLLKKSLENFNFEIIEFKNITLQDFKNEFCSFIDYVKINNPVNDSNIIIYFAGHGISDESLDGLNGYLIFSDSQNGDINTYLPMSEFLKLINEVPFKHELIILDSCFSGAFRKLSLSRDAGNVNPFKIFKQHYYHYTKHVSQQVLTSTSFNQKALDYIGTRDYKNKNSPFSTILNQALSIENLGADKIISASKIYSFVYDRLARVTSENYVTQNASFFPLKKHENGEFLFIHKDFDPENLKECEYKNPYKGLRSYEVEDYQMFFGRTDTVNKIWGKLLKQQLVSIIGMSGMGKSSILKAGIANKIKNESISYIIIRPQELNFNDPKIIDSTILIIDQFEEIITNFNAIERVEILNGINEFLLNDKTKKIVLSLRIDFELPIFSTHLNDFWENSKVYLQPLTHNQIKEIIEGPATRVGRFFEPTIFVNDIIEEVLSNPNSLPLLSFTLSELYTNCIGQPYKTITKEDYLSLGGVKGGVFKCADNIYTKLSTEERESFKRIVIRMTSYANGQFSKKRVFDIELIFNDEKENYRVERVKKLFIDNRLFTIDSINNKTFIEPSHEILILGWDKSQEWRDEFSVSNIIVLENFSIAANLYVNDNSESTVDILSKSYLWNNDPRFDIILEIDKKDPLFFNKIEKEFLEKSKEKKDSILKKLKNDKNRAISQSISYKAEIEKNRDPLKALYMAYKADAFFPTDISYDSFSNIYIENIFDELRTSNKTYFKKIVTTSHYEKFFGLGYSEIYELNQELEIIDEIKILEENERFSLMEINNDYKIIIVGGEKGSVFKYNFETKKIIQLFKQELAITHISFFNNLLISCCEDSEIIIYDFDNSKILNKIDGNEYIPHIEDSYGGIYFIKDSSKKDFQQRNHKDNKVQSFFIYESVLVISFRTLLITYDISKKEIIKHIDINSGIDFIAKIIDEDSTFSFLLFLTYEGELFEYYFDDCYNKIESNPIRKHLFSPNFNESYSIQQLENGYRVSIGRDNGELTLYYSTDKTEKKIPCHIKGISSLCFIGNHLITNSYDRSIKKWVLDKEISSTGYQAENMNFKFLLNDNKILGIIYTITETNSVWQITFIDDFRKELLYRLNLNEEVVNICISEENELLIFHKNKMLIYEIIRNENKFPIELNNKNIITIGLNSTDIKIIKFLPKSYGNIIIFSLGSDNSINLLRYKSKELDIEKIKIESPPAVNPKITSSGRGATNPISIIPFFDGDQIIIGLWFNILLYSISKKEFKILATDFGQLHSLLYHPIEKKLLISTDRHIFKESISNNNLIGSENILEYSISNNELENVIFPNNLPKEYSHPKFLFYANKSKWVISISHKAVIVYSISLNKIIHTIESYKIENCAKYETRDDIYIIINTSQRLTSYKIQKPNSLITKLGVDKFSESELGINFEE